MTEYSKLLALFMVATAAIVAYVLVGLLPQRISGGVAIVSMCIAIFLTSKMDMVGSKFRTHIDDQFDEGFKRSVLLHVVVAFVVAGAVATTFGAVVGAVTGILALQTTLRKFM